MSLKVLYIISKRVMLTRLVCAFWIIAKIISWKVWVITRLFPVVPPFSFLFVPSFIHIILFSLSLLTLSLLLFHPSKTLLQWSLIVIEFLSCLLDQNRWQPWEYQYIFIILALIINKKNDTNAFTTIVFILITFYFFSGINKCNAVFSKDVLHQLSQARIITSGNFYLYNLITYHLGCIAGSIEILLGIGLIFYRFRKWTAIFLIIMHLLIIAIFGPFGINYDVIIWPWNILMIAILYLFFLSNHPVLINFNSLLKGWNKLYIILFGILPILNFFGYWDFYLSASLFSYKPPDMYICVHNFKKEKALNHFALQNENKNLCDSNSILINVRSWSFDELKVPAYPETRVYKNIKEQLLKRFPDMDATFIEYIYTDGKKIKTEIK